MHIQRPRWMPRPGPQTGAVVEDSWTLTPEEAVPAPSASQSRTETAPGHISGYSVGAWSTCSATTCWKGFE